MQSAEGVDIRKPPMHQSNQLPAGQLTEQPRVPHETFTRTPNLSKEEQRILAECRSEAYFYRSLPLSVVLGSATIYAVKTGLLSASQRFGHWPKSMLGALVGYFVGKVSYASVCQEKFLKEAPNSELGRTIRKARGEIVPESDGDTNRSHEEGLFPDGKDTANTGGDTGYSDYFANPQIDKSVEEQGRRGGTLTYDQLRAQHRQKEMEKPYMQQGALIKPSTPVDPSKINVPPASYSPQPQPPIESINMYTEVQSDPSEFSSVPPPGTRKRTNKYGDEGFE